MLLNQERIQAILSGKHAYYGWQAIPIRKDYRWIPARNQLIASHLSLEMNVLDIGCGNGGDLFELSPFFKTGLGIDHNPEHLQSAEKTKSTRGIKNVAFCLMDYQQVLAHLQPASFDLVFSMRGPAAESSEGLQSAYRLLRHEGMFFCEMIAENHQKEVAEIFPDRFALNKGIRVLDKVKARLEQHGFDVRLAADVYSKWIYPDVYAWVEYISHLWTWLEIPLPAPDDPRITEFAERYTNAAGEIETTHHVAWLAGLKH